MTDQKPDRQDGDGLMRTFDMSGTILRRMVNVFTITCESAEIANRVADQLRTPSPTRDGAEGANGARDVLRSICKAGGELGCSCADQNYQWFDQGCKELITKAYKKLLASVPPKPTPDAMREALANIEALSVCIGVVDPSQHTNMLSNIARISQAARLSAPVPPADGADDKIFAQISEKSREWAETDIAERASPAVAAEPDLLIGLDERLDRLCLTAKDGNRFILSTDSAKNIVGIVREWIRVKFASPLVRGDREAIMALIEKHVGVTMDLTEGEGVLIGVEQATDAILSLFVKPAAIDKTAAAQIVATNIYGSKLENLEGVQADACRGIVTEILELAGAQSGASEREPTPDMRIAGGIAWAGALKDAETYVDCADACWKAMWDAR